VNKPEGGRHDQLQVTQSKPGRAKQRACGVEKKPVKIKERSLPSRKEKQKSDERCEMTVGKKDDAASSRGRMNRGLGL